MYADRNKRPITDNAVYVDEHGTRFPSNYPKREINGLTQVVETPFPQEEGKVVTGFIVNEDYVQIWQMRDKTAEELQADAEKYKLQRAAEYPPVGDQLDAIWKAIDTLNDNGIVIHAETLDMLDTKILAVKAKYPKQEA